MFCKNCGIPLEDGTQTCPTCGIDLSNEITAEVTPEETVAAPETPAPVAPTIIYKIPPENEPLSAWSYFWLKVLFSVPIVGFVFLMVFTFHGGNVNRRSFARSYWCGLLVTLIVLAVIMIITFGIVGGLRQGYYY